MVRCLRVLIFLGGGAVSILVAPGLFRKLRQSVNYLNVKSVSQEMRDFLVVFFAFNRAELPQKHRVLLTESLRGLLSRCPMCCLAVVGPR